MTEFTDAQVLAIQPFIPALLKRYREVAETGMADRPDQICTKVPVGHCYDCPVFGSGVGQRPGHWTKPKKDAQPKWVEGEEWLHCGEGYWPEQPKCLDDTTKGVTCGEKPDHVALLTSGPNKGQPRWPGRKTSREQAQEWGAAMVRRLEELRERGAELQKATVAPG